MLHPTLPDDLAVALDEAVEAEDAARLAQADLDEMGIKAFTVIASEDFVSPTMASLMGTFRAFADRGPRTYR